MLLVFGGGSGEIKHKNTDSEDLFDEIAYPYYCHD